MTTDKHIIIDGVDVSGCEKQGETINGITCGNGERIRLANEIITKHKLCKDNPNCYYKQLKRKEQECEELKGDLWSKEESLKDYIEHFNKASDELDQLKFDYAELEKRHNDSFEQFKQLKAENEELKKRVNELEECEDIFFQENEDFRKIYSCLQEIKEIAEKCRSSLYGYDQERYPKQILQKISEVEDANV